MFRLDHPGGVQSCVLSLIRGLNTRGITPVLLWDQPPSSKMLEEGRCELDFQPIRLPIPSPYLDRLPHSLRYLARVVGSVPDENLPGDIDFFYIFYVPTMISPGRPHLYFLSGPPVVRSLRRTLEGDASHLHRAVDWVYRVFLKRRWPAYEYRKGCRYVINSEYSARAFFDEYGDRIPVVYPPIRGVPKTLTLDELKRRHGVVFFSRIEPSKRPELVLELAEANPEMDFVVMGGVPKNRIPYLHRLRSMAETRKLPNTRFIPNASTDVLTQTMERARFYFFPSVNEHFGMTTGEAIVAGLIPFVHDSGGQREVVPLNELRFTDDQLMGRARMIFSATDKKLLKWHDRLRANMPRFSEAEFVKKMLSALPEGMRI